MQAPTSKGLDPHPTGLLHVFGGLGHVMCALLAILCFPPPSTAGMAAAAQAYGELCIPALIAYLLGDFFVRFSPSI